MSSVNYFEPWTVDDIPDDFREAVDREKRTASPHRWIQWSWLPTENNLNPTFHLGSDSSLTSGKRYKLVDDPTLPESLRPWLPKDPDCVRRLLAGEAVNVNALSDEEFDALEIAWNANAGNGRMYGYSGGLIGGETGPTLRQMRSSCSAPAMEEWHAKIDRPDGRSAPAATPAPEPVPEPETQPKKEEPMKSIEIKKNVVLVAGLPVGSYSAAQRSAFLESLENEVKRLEALEFKTQETLDEIEALRANAKELVEAFDAEYAERKAAKAEK